jgi:hypothetical protein
MPSVVKIGSGIQKLMEEGEIHTDSNDISYAYFIFSK